MEGKLIKKDDHYFLEVEPYTLNILQRNALIANTFDKPKGDILQLSLTNCQAIERGYDLDELVEDYYDSLSDTLLFVDGELKYSKKDFKAGFQKALEILGDKKFTEEELKWLNEAVKEKCYNDQSMNTSVVNKLKSLQQTEWDVVIVTEDTNNQCDGCKSNHDVNDLGMHIYPNSTRAYMVCQKEKYKAPKLDSEGRLILKRK